MDLIAGVRTKPLNVLPDERGRLMEILRCDEDLFQGFGQVYLTTAYPGVVKAWHYHQHQTDHFAVLQGMAKVVLYDDRDGSPTRGQVNEFFIGEQRPLLVQIPPLVLHGFKAIGPGEVLLLNIPTLPYNYAVPDEHRLPPTDSRVPYRWQRQDG